MAPAAPNDAACRKRNDCLFQIRVKVHRTFAVDAAPTTLCWYLVLDQMTMKYVPLAPDNNLRLLLVSGLRTRGRRIDDDKSVSLLVLGVHDASLRENFSYFERE